jgi:hypothetical protein
MFLLRLYSDVYFYFFWWPMVLFIIKINCYKDPLSLNTFNGRGDTPGYSILYLQKLGGVTNGLCPSLPLCLVYSNFAPSILVAISTAVLRVDRAMPIKASLRSRHRPLINRRILFDSSWTNRGQYLDNLSNSVA